MLAAHDIAAVLETYQPSLLHDIEEFGSSREPDPKLALHGGDADDIARALSVERFFDELVRVRKILHRGSDWRALRAAPGCNAFRNRGRKRLFALCCRRRLGVFAGESASEVKAHDLRRAAVLGEADVLVAVQGRGDAPYLFRDQTGDHHRLAGELCTHRERHRLCGLARIRARRVSDAHDEHIARARRHLIARVDEGGKLLAERCLVSLFAYAYDAYPHIALLLRFRGAAS